VVPFVVNGELVTDRPCGELTPVVMLMLSRYGIPVRGPAVADLGVRADLGEVRDYNLANLRDYWLTILPGPDDLAGMADDDPVDAASVSWLMTGPARLHYTLAHADIISKAGSAGYLATLFPAYGELARRAVAWRADPGVTFTVADLKSATASVRAIADDAWLRYAPRTSSS
jgi:hypothetical protein